MVVTPMLGRCLWTMTAPLLDWFRTPRDRIVELAPDGPDPRHIEAIMRVRNDDIERLSRRRFAREVAAARALAAVDPSTAERVARAFKL